MIRQLAIISMDFLIDLLDDISFEIKVSKNNRQQRRKRTRRDAHNARIEVLRKELYRLENCDGDGSSVEMTRRSRRTRRSSPDDFSESFGLSGLDDCRTGRPLEEAFTGFGEPADIFPQISLDSPAKPASRRQRRRAKSDDII